MLPKPFSLATKLQVSYLNAVGPIGRQWLLAKLQMMFASQMDFV